MAAIQTTALVRRLSDGRMATGWAGARRQPLLPRRDRPRGRWLAKADNWYYLRSDGSCVVDICTSVGAILARLTKLLLSRLLTGDITVTTNEDGYGLLMQTKNVCELLERVQD